MIAGFVTVPAEPDAAGGFADEHAASVAATRTAARMRLTYPRIGRRDQSAAVVTFDACSACHSAGDAQKPS